MIRLYAWPTPDARKITVLLEETGVPYLIERRELPPAIEDDDVPLELAEPGAILIYLAERTGRLFPVERRFRYPTLQWLFYRENEGIRLCTSLERRLRETEFLGGVYSIADVSAYPWVMRHVEYGLDLESFPSVKRWTETISARAAVQRGMAALKS